MAATVLRRSYGMRGSGAEVPKKEGKMTTSIKLAVPTMGAAGLNAERSGHFGHCDCFTVVDIVDGVVSEEATMVANPPHEEGGCLRPVGLLADAGCNAIVAAGMGMRPLMGFNQAGITVYYDAEHPIVGDAARAVAAGEAPIMSADQACNHHH